MKTWNETLDVLEQAVRCLAENSACAIVVLTHVKGSAFRRPGAKLLIRADSTMTGNVSGGCLENDLRERALKAIATNTPERVHYNTGSDEDTIWGLGLGCDGELDLLIVPVHPPGTWVRSILAAMSEWKPLSVAWPMDAAHRDCAPYPITDTSATGEAFLDHLEPPPDLVVVGAGDDAIPLVALAAESGFRVTVCDHRPGYLAPERFPRAHRVLHLRPESAEGVLPVHPRTMVVIKNHALEMDGKWAAFFDRTDIAYIGLLGPQKRCAKIREQMTSGHTARIHGPAGLDLGSEGAEQIAVSIVAELLAVASDRKPIHLRERDAPIHGR